jgi:hypothetical protein
VIVVIVVMIMCLNLSPHPLFCALTNAAIFWRKMLKNTELKIKMNVLDENTNTPDSKSIEGSENMKKLKYATKNPFKYDSSESESEEEESKVQEEEKKRDKVVKPSLPSWRTTFFFTDNDSRFKGMHIIMFVSYSTITNFLVI